MLDFVGFARSGYRSVLGYLARKFEFWSRYVDGTDTLVFADENLFWNVNIPPTMKKHTIIVQYYSMFLCNLVIVHFCKLRKADQICITWCSWTVVIVPDWHISHCDISRLDIRSAVSGCRIQSNFSKSVTPSQKSPHFYP